jgi:hypothetical protein
MPVCSRVVASRYSIAQWKDKPPNSRAAPELLAHLWWPVLLNLLFNIGSAEHALERSANIEAVAHYRTGLALLKGLPEGVGSERAADPDRPRQRSHLGQGLRTKRVRHMSGSELCLEIGENQRLFPVLYGLWNFDVIAARYIKGKQIANQLVELAEQHGESGPLVAAYSALGSTFAYMGSWPDGNENLEKCITLYDPESHANLKFECAEDPCVQANAASALCLDPLS